MSTALQAAMAGKNLPPEAAKGALSQAVDRVKNLTKQAANAKEAVTNVLDESLYTVEEMTTMFGASAAEGYWGEDKMAPWDIIDVRAATGGTAIVLGIGMVATGSEKGKHIISLGKGLFGAYIASVGRRAGKRLAEKKAETPPADPAAAQAGQAGTGAPAAQIQANATVQGEERQVHLSPVRPRNAASNDNRFVRARAR